MISVVDGESGNIALIGPFPPLRGGISLFNLELKKAFQKKGYKVLSAGYKRQYPELLFPGTSELMPEKQITARPEPDQIIDTCNPFTWFEAVDIILDSGADFAVISWWHPWFLLVSCFIADRLKKAGVKFCFLCHNFRHHGASSAFWDFFIKKMMSKADFIIFLSDAVAETAERSFSGSFGKFFSRSFSRTVRGHVGDARPSIITLFHPVYKTDNIKTVHIPDKWSKKILMAGYIRGYKGIEYGIGLLDLDEEFTLTIAGEFYDKKLLSEVMEKKGRFGSRLVIIPRYLTDYDLVDIIDNHDILICPYVSASQSGVVALSHGRATPVAVFPSGGLADQVSRDTGVVCDDISTGSLKKAIDEIYLKTPVQWADNIRKESSHKTWELFLEKIQRRCFLKKL